MEKTNAESPFVPGLISIVSPCWNSETFVHRLLDSVLDQDYPNVEMIVVNDGSTDGTAGVLAGYEKKFRSRGYVLKNLYQENAGQAAALDVGLKKFSGEFLIWTDSDDYFLVKNALSTFVDFLRKNPDIGFVVSSAAQEKSNGQIIHFEKSRKGEKNRNVFRELLERKIFFLAGTLMVRTETFLKAIPTRSIFTSRFGQNAQMELPIAYVSKCGFITEELYCYVERLTSHSHTHGRNLSYINAGEEIAQETLKRIEMPETDRKRYEKLSRKAVSQERLGFYFFGYFRELKKMKADGVLEWRDVLRPPYLLVRRAVGYILTKIGFRRSK